MRPEAKMYARIQVCIEAMKQGRGVPDAIVQRRETKRIGARVQANRMERMQKDARITNPAGEHARRHSSLAWLEA